MKKGCRPYVCRSPADFYTPGSDEHGPRFLTGGPGAAPGGVASKNGWVYMRVQVKSSQELLPGIHETFFLEPATGRGKAR